MGEPLHGFMTSSTFNYSCWMTQLLNWNTDFGLFLSVSVWVYDLFGCKQFIVHPALFPKSSGMDSISAAARKKTSGAENGWAGGSNIGHITKRNHFYPFSLPFWSSNLQYTTDWDKCSWSLLFHFKAVSVNNSRFRQLQPLNQMRIERIFLLSMGSVCHHQWFR